MESNNISESSKFKQVVGKISEQQKRDFIINVITEFLLSYKSVHYGLDNFSPFELYESILLFSYINEYNDYECDLSYIDFFFEDYPCKDFFEAINELAICLLKVFQYYNIQEMNEIEISATSIEDAIISKYMKTYYYI
tara:strand:+ start:2779 stop:3192 length:414 start_codon:yes stop_codon:yes gene_type:complete